MLNDYRGYRLGLSAAVLDSVYAFRRAGGIIRTMDEFARITGLSSEECSKLQAYFRFPVSAAQQPSQALARRRILDLNRVSAFELQQINGIGPVLSERIIKFRKSLGGFLHERQLLDVYGLDPNVAKRAIDRFKVLSPPDIKRMDVNAASAEELSRLLYLSPRMAADLVAYRIQFGPLRSADELAAIESIPKDRIDRIALYLQFR
jgi:DNA uptake protein ComE-like DNA-binding protein